jgi:hypothetical protein
LSDFSELDQAVTVRHYTSDLGRAQITESASLKKGVYVTLPGEIPAGATQADVERILEIDAGKGANYIDIQVPGSGLSVPDTGEFTSGGAWQRQLNSQVPIDPGAFNPS